MIAQLEERKIKLENYWVEYNVIQTKLELVDDVEANDCVYFEEAFFTSAKIQRSNKLCVFDPLVHIAF